MKFKYFLIKCILELNIVSTLKSILKYGGNKGIIDVNLSDSQYLKYGGNKGIIDVNLSDSQYLKYRGF